MVKLYATNVPYVYNSITLNRCVYAELISLMAFSVSANYLKKNRATKHGQ